MSQSNMQRIRDELYKAHEKPDVNNHILIKVNVSDSDAEIRTKFKLVSVRIDEGFDPLKEYTVMTTDKLKQLNRKLDIINTEINQEIISLMKKSIL